MAQHQGEGQATALAVHMSAHFAGLALARGMCLTLLMNLAHAQARFVEALQPRSIEGWRDGLREVATAVIGLPVACVALAMLVAAMAAVAVGGIALVVFLPAVGAIVGGMVWGCYTGHLFSGLLVACMGLGYALWVWEGVMWLYVGVVAFLAG
jgi:hypothetical protein